MQAHGSTSERLGEREGDADDDHGRGRGKREARKQKEKKSGRETWEREDEKSLLISSRAPLLKALTGCLCVCSAEHRH